jgi:type IV pilus assembly protein PilX
MRYFHISAGLSQQGAVLVTSLVFLLIMTLVAVVAMQSTIMDQKISTNVASKTKSLEYSESPRPKAADVMDDHAFERGWTGVLKTTTSESADYAGLNVVDKNKDLYLENIAGEDPLDPSTLTTDMTYSRSAGTETISSDLTVYRNVARGLAGHSAAMISGYEGTGKAMAGGGSAIFFDIRSKAQGAARAETVTSADTRVIIRN